MKIQILQQLQRTHRELAKLGDMVHSLMAEEATHSHQEPSITPDSTLTPPQVTKPVLSPLEPVQPPTKVKLALVPDPIDLWDLWDLLNPGQPRPALGSPEYVSLYKQWSQGRPGSHPGAKGKTVARPSGVTDRGILRVLGKHPDGLVAEEMGQMLGVTPQSVGYNIRRHLYPQQVICLGLRNRARIWALATLYPVIAAKQQAQRQQEVAK